LLDAQHSACVGEYHVSFSFHLNLKTKKPVVVKHHDGNQEQLFAAVKLYRKNDYVIKFVPK